MMKSRWTRITLLIGLLICAALLASCWIPSTTGVTRANFDRVADGMTCEEVETIFGCAPSLISERGDARAAKNQLEREDKITVVWQDGHGRALTVFDQQGRLMYKVWRSESSLFFERLQRKLLLF